MKIKPGKYQTRGAVPSIACRFKYAGVLRPTIRRIAQKGESLAQVTTNEETN